MSYDNIVQVTNQDGGQGLIDDCKKMMDDNKNRLYIKNWRQYYVVFKIGRKPNGKIELEELFEVESGHKDIGDTVKSITVGGTTYSFRKSGADLMNKILVAYEKQISRKLKKQKAKIEQAKTNVQKIYE